VPSRSRSGSGTSRPGRPAGFSSPSLVDLDGDGRKEIVAPFYSTFVFDAQGHLLGKGRSSKGRVYAPGVVTDLEGDGIEDIVVGGNEGTVAAYEFRGGKLQRKPGWPASTKSGGQAPEVRGLAAADLDGDGRGRGGGTTTNTSSKGSQVFVFDANGRCSGRVATRHAWPRNRGYGAYGENVGIGTSTTTRSSRSSPPSTTTRSTRSTSTAPRSSPRRGSPTPSPARRGSGWPGATSSGGPARRSSAPLPPAQGGVAEPGPPAVAAVDRIPSVGRRPGR
jgi:hypothetical protein